MEAIREFLDFLLSQVRSIQITDIVDIVLVTVVLYYIFKFIRDRRAGKLLVGVVFFIVVQMASNALGLVAMSFILQNIFQVGLIALLIIFQPELRSMLEKMGAEPLRGLRKMGSERMAELQMSIEAICAAACDLSKDKTGAIIVLEKNVKLGEHTKSGTILDAKVSSYLLRNIFHDKAPLHDGAVIIRGNTIHAAGCFLPMSASDNIVRDLGARHRAALGISENSDAVVVVVSEETGIISVAYNGQFSRNLDHASLSKTLVKMAIESHTGKRRHSLDSNGEKSEKPRKSKKKSNDDITDTKDDLEIHAEINKGGENDNE